MNMTTKTERLAAATLSDPRWADVAQRNRAADGKFVYSVRTTGVYCRPSCAARPARPENVRFHASPAHAERAGFRACKRCRPNAQSPVAEQAAQIAALCRWIEQSENHPSLESLAARAGMSRYHLHRVFKAVTGVTPKAYADAHRSKRVREELDRSRTVTDAIYGAGFGSNGRFYASADRMLGMNPTAYRAGGANTEIRFAIGECSLGSILVAATARGICAISMGNDPEALVRDLQDRFPRATLLGADAAFERMVAQVIEFVEAPKLGLDLPLDVRGTAFQRRVWEALRAIPAGKKTSYTALAQALGAPKAARAVAHACAANPLAVAIPCHRVVHRDGSISGYRWGVERKRALLEREADERDRPDALRDPALRSS
jgi:AraC family transcriptional regulator of adaptative response/methylated-DNA-[protein]-cysteine methyltransferase